MVVTKRVGNKQALMIMWKNGNLDTPVVQNSVATVEKLTVPQKVRYSITVVVV